MVLAYWEASDACEACPNPYPFLPFDSRNLRDFSEFVANFPTFAVFNPPHR